MIAVLLSVILFLGAALFSEGGFTSMDQWPLYKTGVDNVKNNCTGVALRNAATYLSSGVRVRIAVGRKTKTTDLLHAQAEAFDRGKWVPIVTKNGYLTLDPKGSDFEDTPDQYLNFREAVAKWSIQR